MVRFKKSNYRILRRGDGRYEVRLPGGKRINGMEKTKILLEAGLIKTKLPAPAPETPKSEET